MSPTASSRLIVAEPCVRTVVDPLEVDLVGAGEARSFEAGRRRTRRWREAAVQPDVVVRPEQHRDARPPRRRGRTVCSSASRAGGRRGAAEAGSRTRAGRSRPRRSPRSSGWPSERFSFGRLKSSSRTSGSAGGKPGGRRLSRSRAALADRVARRTPCSSTSARSWAAVHEGRGRAHALRGSSRYRARAAVDAIAGERRAAVDDRCRPGEGRARVAGERGEAGRRAGRCRAAAASPEVVEAAGQAAKADADIARAGVRRVARRADPRPGGTVVVPGLDDGAADAEKQCRRRRVVVERQQLRGRCRCARGRPRQLGKSQFVRSM